MKHLLGTLFLGMLNIPSGFANNSTIFECEAHRQWAQFSFIPHSTISQWERAPLSYKNLTFNFDTLEGSIELEHLSSSPTVSEVFNTTCEESERFPSRDRGDKILPGGIVYACKYRVESLIQMNVEVIRYLNSALDATSLDTAEFKIKALLPYGIYRNGDSLPLNGKFEKQTSIIDGQLNSCKTK